MSKPWYEHTDGEIREAKRVRATTPREEHARAGRIARSYDRLVADGHENEADALFDAPAPIC